ncbi:hypothetical protein [Roseobacter sp. S98]|uniref:hypothetical protein n=1 Tax=Roseobacter algicola (ex Choi et al. 2025) (nom. illeg.) TaxID=3092138 RepID=UPI003F510CB0
MAIIYLWLEATAGVPLSDWALVALVVINAYVVYVFGLHISRDLAEMLLHLPRPDFVPDGLDIQGRVNRIIAHPPAVLAGILYGAALGAGAYIIAPHQTNETLRIAFGLFVCAGSSMIGFGLWAIFRFWRGFLRVLPTLELDILNLSKEPVPAFLRFNSRVVLLCAFVGSMAILGLALADYKSTPPIIIFSICTFLTVGATYAVPTIPLSNRLNRLRSEELDKIEQQISRHVAALSDPNVNTEGLRKLNELREAQGIISGIKTLPPGGQISVSATAFVTALSFLPAGIQYIQQMMAVP